jgi:hypothetical protein
VRFLVRPADREDQRRTVGVLESSGNYDELTSAIDELRSTAVMLNFDLYDEISLLEDYRDNLPEDEDYYDTRSQIQPPSTPRRNELDELHGIFGSLL